MKIALLPQNKAHLDNFIQLIEDLSLHGNFEFTIINFDGVLHQNIEEINTKNINTVVVDTKLEKSFYRLNRIQKIIALIKIRRDIKKLSLPRFDSLIHGGESALFYALLSQAKGTKAIIGIVDGQISNEKFIKNIFYKFLNWSRGAFRFFGISPFVPSVIGSNINSLLIVVSNGTRDAIIDRGYKGKILVSKLPRHNKIMQSQRMQKSRGMVKCTNILYACTAFTWHGLSKYANSELNSIKKLIEILKDNKSYTLKIRPHPRGDGGVLLDPLINSYITNSSLVEDLNWADCVLSAGSSISVEAKIMGIKAAVWQPDLYNIDSQTPIVQDTNLGLIYTKEELTGYFESKANFENELNCYDCDAIYRCIKK